MESAAQAGRVITAKHVDQDDLDFKEPGLCYLLEHPRLDFVSYPYEWSFSALRAAALLTLDLHIDALEYGVSMSDASAFNVQFDGPRPVFVDYLSFRQYQEGEFWAGHRQFCEQFLNPLLLTANTGVSFNSLYRGNLYGIRPDELAPLLPIRSRLSPRILAHVYLQARLRTPKVVARAADLSRTRLPKYALRSSLAAMRSWVAKLQPSPSRHTIWTSYASANSYSPMEYEAKRHFVAEFSRTMQPAVLWDLGCNTGDFAEVALESGAELVIGFEGDHGVLDLAYKRACADGLRFFPVYSDLANPSPDQGWAQRERLGLGSRSPPNSLLALALVHHLAISQNVPLSYIVEWLTKLAPTGVIEFIPKSDPMVQQLLAVRKDIFASYSRSSFLSLLREHAHILKVTEITDTGRLLASYDCS